MPIENIESVATSVGIGGITGFLGYFMRKIIKIVLFAVGGILALDVSTIPRTNYC